MGIQSVRQDRSLFTVKAKVWNRVFRLHVSWAKPLKEVVVENERICGNGGSVIGELNIGREFWKMPKNK